MIRAKRRRKAPLVKRLLFPALSALALVVLALGFVSNTRIAVINEQHGPLGAEHPWDWQAEGCLGLAMVLLAVLYLSRPSPRRWRKSARSGRQNLVSMAKSAKRTRPERVQ